MKPIGYWLNRADQAITHHMNAALQEYGLTRIAWQVLNVIQDTPGATDADVLSVLSANADTATLTAAIDTLLTDGWATRPASHHLSLTADGRTRLATVSRRIDAFRALSTDGISDDDYRTAVNVLERMTHNLQPADPTE
ncbi:MarR family winged helix-turn-helix transcriptional regulator [Actinomadura harenae]|uniref:MarR family transcriptional regulator n=1 Tax=Actinomadura harenae TaxID=2483351 RepID=A0A3M2KXL6_9ACTN|nr:MarR family transcriptional regulator [Actinomadura harenae]RMI29386.1 MarR family transcriptional regulator [Actinomadura harenae]